MGLDMWLNANDEEIGYWRKANAIHNWFVINVQNGEDECNPNEVSKTQLEELLSICQNIVSNSKLIPGLVQNGSRSIKGGPWERIFEQGHIVEDPSYCIEHLPSSSGFFFGDTNYDDNYLENVQKTIKILELALTLVNTKTITYCSSW